MGQLDERYRTPLVLRYYEDVTPAEIANQLGIPLRTVHTRLRRGLQKLRERMDAAGGGRERWSSMLLMTAMAPRQGHASQVPGLLRASLSAGILLSVLALSTWWLPAAITQESGAPELAHDAPPPFRRGNARNEARHLRVGLRQARPGVAGLGAERRERSIEGEVLDWNGVAVQGAGVRAQSFSGLRFGRYSTHLVTSGEPRHVARTDRAGRFRVANGILSGDQIFTGHSEGQTTVVIGCHRANATQPLIVVAPARELLLRIVNEVQDPLPDVRVRVEFGDALPARFDRSLRDQHRASWSRVSDSRGVVRWDALPHVAEGELIFEREGYVARRVNLMQVTSLVVMRQPRAALRIAGCILGPSGRPRVDAEVHTKAGCCRTEADGSFSLRMRTRTGGPMTVVAPGLAIHEVSLASERLGGSEVIQLGVISMSRQQESLAGTVRDSRGLRVSGARIWILGATWCEGCEASGSGPLESVAGFWRRDHTVTDSRGAFEIGGLDGRRAYRLRVIDPRTAAALTTEALHPAANVDLQFPEDATIDCFEATLQDCTGTPLAGASVIVQTRTPELMGSTVFVHGSETTSGPDGRFRLTHVPRHSVSLTVHHERTLRTTFAIEEHLEEGTLVVPLQAQLRVEALDLGGLSAYVQLLGERGQVLDCWLPTGSGSRKVREIQLHAGRSGVLDVPASATAVRLHVEGRLEEYRAIHLRAGETNVLELRVP